MMNGDFKRIPEMTLERVGLGARADEKVLRVARTVADLEGIDTIGESHVAEAVRYRSLDLRVGA